MSAPDLDVFPVVNLAGPGCNGTEATLLECGADRFFNGPDADVACRQLGFGAGTQQPQLLRSSGPAAECAPDLDVFPVVNLSGPGCNGSEATLLGCRADPAFGIGVGSQQECFGTGRPGLRVRCVVEAEEGAHAALGLLRQRRGPCARMHTSHAWCQIRTGRREAGAAGSVLQDSVVPATARMCPPYNPAA